VERLKTQGILGARCQTRTGTAFRPTDFKSVTTHFSNNFELSRQ